MIFLATGACSSQATITRETPSANLLEKQKSAIFPGSIQGYFQTCHRMVRRSYSPIGEKDRESTMRFIYARPMARPPSSLATEVQNGSHPTASGCLRFSTLVRNWRCCRPVQVKQDRWSVAPLSNTIMELAGSRMGSESSSRAGNQATTGAAIFRASRAAPLVPSRLREQPELQEESLSRRIA